MDKNTQSIGESGLTTILKYWKWDQDNTQRGCLNDCKDQDKILSLSSEEFACEAVSSA